MKIALRNFSFVAIVALAVLVFSGCAGTGSILDRATSNHTVDELKDKIHIAMLYDDAVAAVGSMPVVLNNNLVHFILADGDLWLNVERDMNGKLCVQAWTFEKKEGDKILSRFSSMDKENSVPLTEPDRIIITVTSQIKGKSFTGKYKIDAYSIFNQKTDFEVGKVNGSFILLGGRYYLVKASGLDEKHVMAPLQDTTLQYKQLMYFIMKARQNGKKDEAGVYHIKFEDKNNPFVMPLPGGNIFRYPSPWLLTGTFNPTTGEFNFDFGNWKFKNCKVKHKQNFLGTMTSKLKGVALRNDFSIKGWKVYRLTPKGAEIVTDVTDSLGELRKQLKSSAKHAKK